MSDAEKVIQVQITPALMHYETPKCSYSNKWSSKKTTRYKDKLEGAAFTEETAGLNAMLLNEKEI